MHSYLDVRHQLERRTHPSLNGRGARVRGSSGQSSSNQPVVVSYNEWKDERSIVEYPIETRVHPTNRPLASHWKGSQLVKVFSLGCRISIPGKLSYFIAESVRRISTVRLVDINLEHNIWVWNSHIVEAEFGDVEMVSGVEDGRVIPFWRLAFVNSTLLLTFISHQLKYSAAIAMRASDWLGVHGGKGNQWNNPTGHQPDVFLVEKTNRPMPVVMYSFSASKWN